MNTINPLILTSLLALTACPGYVVARVTVTPEALTTTDKGIPGKVTGVVENHGKDDTLLDSHNFTFDGKNETFDFKVRKGTTVVTTIRYPGGASAARKTIRVPENPSENPWPLPLVIEAVDLETQKASSDFLQQNAESLALIHPRASNTASNTPPSTNYEQVAKYMGALTIVSDKWKPGDAIMQDFIANVRVLNALPAPTSGVSIQKKLSVETTSAATAALSIPVYGSLNSSVAAGSHYKMNFAITHNAILDLDHGIILALLDPRNNDGSAALAQLDFWASLHPKAKILALRSVRYIVSGTIGVTKGQAFTSNIDAAVASVFTTTAGYSFNLNDEVYVPLTGLVTAWEWKLQEFNIRDLVDMLKKKRNATAATESPKSPTLSIDKDFPSKGIIVPSLHAAHPGVVVPSP